MIRRILILLAALALGLSGLPAFAEDAFEAGELHVYRASMDENETVPGEKPGSGGITGKFE